MTFDQLKYFITVAKYLNFSRAAQALFVTQSTLSRSIAAMESELNVTLFDRRYHSIRLTPAGELLYREGQVIRDSIDDLFQRLQELDSSKKSRLSIGVLDGQKIETRIILAVKSVMEQMPEFGIDVRRIDYAAAIQELWDGKLDMIQTVVPPGERLDDRFGQILIENENYYLVARNDDPVWQQDGLPLEAFDGKVVLVPHAYPGIEAIEQYFRDANVLPRFQDSPDMETLSLWIESGMGVSICNASHVTCSSGVKRPVRVEPIPALPRIPMMLLWNRENVPPLLERLLSFIV